MRRLVTAAVAAGALVAAVSRAQAATFTVTPSDDQGTIQAVIDASAPGDTIRFAVGTYNVALYIPHRLKLERTGSGKAILDGSGLYSPVLTLGASATGVTIQNLTFRFSGWDWAPVIDAGDGGYDGLTVQSCVFRATDNGTVVASGDSILLKSNVSRGNVEGFFLEGSNLLVHANKHRATLEDALDIGAYGDVLVTKERVAGGGSVGIEIEDYAWWFAEGTGAHIVDAPSMRRSTHGVDIESYGGASVVNGTFINGSGRAITYAGESGFAAENNSFTNCGTCVQTEGDDVHVVDNRVRGANIGVYAVGEAYVADNDISDVVLGIRVASPAGDEEEWGASAHEGGVTQVLDNSIKNAKGIGIVVNDVGPEPTVWGNTLRSVSGRAYFDVLLNLDEFSGPQVIGFERQRHRYGAITLSRTVYADVFENAIGDVESGHGIGLYRSHRAEIRDNRIGAFSQFPFGDPSTKEQERENLGIDLNGIDVAWSTPSEGYYFPFPVTGIDSYFYSLLEGSFFYSKAPVRGVNPDYYFFSYAGLGYDNVAEENVVSAAGAAGGGGVVFSNQIYASVASNLVYYSGGTGILLASVDSTYVEQNFVKDSERDGIWLVSRAYYVGPGALRVGSDFTANRILNNIVVGSGAEGIQNNASATGGYCISGYWLHEPYSYFEYVCTQYGGSGGATIIAYNSVSGSGIADLANDGDVDVDLSNGNVLSGTPQDDVPGFDWYDLPVRQY